MFQLTLILEPSCRTWPFAIDLAKPLFYFLRCVCSPSLLFLDQPLADSIHFQFPDRPPPGFHVPIEPTPSRNRHWPGSDIGVG